METPKRLDIDPFEIESWEDYAKACRDAGEFWRFKKSLSDYIYFTNRPCYQEIREYVNRRMGEWAHDEIMDKLRRIRYERERKRELAHGFQEGT